MSTTLLLVLVIAAPPQSSPSAAALTPDRSSATLQQPADAPSTADEKQQSPRPVKQLRTAITETLRREALSKDEAEQTQAVRDLITLAVEVRVHPKLVDNSVGKSMTRRLENRLRRIAQKMKRNQARDQAKRNAQQRRRRPINVELPKRGDDLRAQIGFGAGGNNQPGDAPQPSDDGEALVELIEQVIAPASWEVNGGRGVIIYFKSRRVLVVRQRGEAHEALGELIEGLNRN